MTNVNQIVISTLLRAVSSTQASNSSSTNASYDFNSILENTIGSLSSINSSCSTCNHSSSNSLNTLNTLITTLNYNKVNNQVNTETSTNNNQSSTTVETNSNQSTTSVDKTTSNTTSSKMDNAIELLKKQVGKKYVWGATGPNEFDCSGLVKYIYKEALGKDIPRVSYDQSKFGQAVDKKDLQVGDLVFFDTMNKGRVSHVGMYIGNNEFIHASNARDGVKKSTLTGYYEKTYKGARRP